VPLQCTVVACESIWAGGLMVRLCDNGGAAAHEGGADTRRSSDNTNTQGD
jgi:hypothetical protein